MGCLTSAGAELLRDTPQEPKPGGLQRAKDCQATQYP